MGTASAAGRQRTTTRASVARQIKDQRRGYARAVLRTLARTQQEPPHRFNACCVTPSPRWECVCRPATLHQLASDITAGRPVDLG